MLTLLKMLDENCDYENLLVFNQLKIHFSLDYKFILFV